jgi:L-rhamnose mutarotase
MASPSSTLTSVTRVAMTLDIKKEMLDEYVAAHAHPRPEVVKALRAVGLRNLSLWVWRERMFYYAEFVPIGKETFSEAMARYAEMPGGTYRNEFR